MRGALSDERRVCNLLVQLLLAFGRAVTLRNKSSKNHDHISLSHMRLPGPGLCIYIISSYGSQGYGGGILIRLHYYQSQSQS
jgi:hypothetical protein